MERSRWRKKLQCAMQNLKKGSLKNIFLHMNKTYSRSTK